MGKVLTARGVGGPDFLETMEPSIKSVTSIAGNHFTDALAKDASEQENLTGLVSNKIIIRSVSISSNQTLHLRLEFYSKDTFTDSDLDEDSFVGSVDLDLPSYGIKL